MSSMTKDPLLATATIGTVIVRIFIGIGIFGCVAGIIALLCIKAGVLPESVTVEIGEVNGSGFGAAIAALLLGMVSLALMFDFVKHLAQIIATVGDGDPFIADNAHRLTRMGWLALAVQIIGFIAGLLGDYAEKTLGGDDFSLDVNLTLSGLALAVILFILARVFRKGAEMRAELEGTV